MCKLDILRAYGMQASYSFCLLNAILYFLLSGHRILICEIFYPFSSTNC